MAVKVMSISYHPYVDFLSFALILLAGVEKPLRIVTTVRRKPSCGSGDREIPSMV